MAGKNKVILTSPPRGTFLEGIVTGTPTPGVVMSMTTAAAVNGRHTWVPSALTTGALQLPLAILLEDSLQGKVITDAYVSGTRCFLYVPLRGEEVNMLLGNVVGTGDIVTVGDLFGIETATGKLIANSSYASTPFKAMESLAALTADAFVWCMVT